jgi:predicted fused transcriptional regulator/phosphomethylpyrimidine kinase
VGALTARLSSREALGDFEAVVDLGGEGVEPSLYLFAEEAIELVERALEIARTYTSSR